MKRSIKIYYADPVTGILAMKFSNGVPGQVSGVQLLLDKIIKLIRTDTGSNLYSPALGASLGKRQALTTDNGLQVQILINAAVENIAKQVLAEQVENTNLDPAQQLASLEVSNIVTGADPTSWYIELLVLTGANETYFLTV
jgi:hypothetical protein